MVASAGGLLFRHQSRHVWVGLCRVVSASENRISDGGVLLLPARNGVQKRCFAAAAVVFDCPGCMSVLLQHRALSCSGRALVGLFCQLRNAHDVIVYQPRRTRSSNKETAGLSYLRRPWRIVDRRVDCSALLSFFRLALHLVHRRILVRLFLHCGFLSGASCTGLDVTQALLACLGAQNITQTFGVASAF